MPGDGGSWRGGSDKPPKKKFESSAPADLTLPTPTDVPKALEKPDPGATQDGASKP